MRMLKYISLIIAIFSCLFLTAEGTRAQVTDVGEFCAVVTFPTYLDPAIAPMNLKMGVLSYGDGHYALNGTVEYCLEGCPFTPINGTAFIQNNIATISLVNTTASPEFTAMHGSLDLTTLTGPFYVMHISPLPTSSISGLITEVPCK